MSSSLPKDFAEGAITADVQPAPPAEEYGLQVSPHCYVNVWYFTLVMWVHCCAFLLFTTLIYFLLGQLKMSYYAAMLGPSHNRQASIHYTEAYEINEEDSYLVRVSRVVQRFYLKLYGRQGIFGVESKYFELDFAFRETTEIASQPFHAYSPRLLIASPAINTLSDHYLQVHAVGAREQSRHQYQSAQPQAATGCANRKHDSATSGLRCKIPIKYHQRIYRARTTTHHVAGHYGTTRVITCSPSPNGSIAVERAHDEAKIRPRVAYSHHDRNHRPHTRLHLLRCYSLPRGSLSPVSAISLAYLLQTERPMDPPSQITCANVDAAIALQQRLNHGKGGGYQEFVDLFMVITVGIATFVVLFRVTFTIFPVAARAPATVDDSALSPSTPGAANGASRNSRARTSATLNPALTGQSARVATAPNGNGLKRHFSVKERLESEIRSILPRRSTYYAMPFFSDSVVNKQEFIESLIELGDDLLDGWLLVKKGVQRGKNWKKRYVVLDGNGRIKYYPNADAARRNINIKGSLAVHAVKPADPLEFGANTLEIRGTLGGTYFFRAEDDLAARKWLCVMTKRAIQGRVPGRIDSYLSSAVLSNGTGASPALANGSAASGKDGASSADAAENAPTASGSSSVEPVSNLKSHSLEVFVEEMSYTKEGSLRQFYIVVKYKSELHDHSHMPVGQSVPKPCEKGVVTWQEQLSWHFQDHACGECDECRAIGSTSGSFCGLPDIMVLHVYEIHLRYLTTKVGETAISLREMFGFTGMKEAQVSCSWPVTSPSDSILGQLSLKLQYSVNSAPGASVTPFLVSSQQERELLGEYDIHSSVKSPAEFFELFFANGTSDKWQEYYKARGDSEMEIGEWTQSKEYGGQVRVLSCRSLTNASIGPSSTMNTTTQHIFFADVASADQDKFVIEVKSFLHDIPYGDCFHVEQVTVVEKGANGNLVAKIYMGIPFSKGCMFKSKIISATRDGVASSTKLCYEMLNRTIDNPSSGGGSSSTSTLVSPFLVSKEEERSVLGEYELHPSVKDGMNFFDLYYADNTQKRWEGYYKAGGDSEHEYGEWTDSPEFGGQVRTIKYRAQSNSSLGPPSTTATQSQHVYFNSKRENVDPDHFVLETKMALHDVPYGDSFTIETVFEVTRESDGKLMVRAYIGVPFSKSTMFKSKIASATKEGMVKSTKLLFQELRKALDKDVPGGGGSDAGGAAEALSNGAVARNSEPAVAPVVDAVVTRNSDVGASRPSGGAPRRAVLARYNSNLDGSVALEEIFENQRVSIFGKWGPNHLLPTDRERFTNRNGDVELSFEQITLPPHWIWTSPWKIDKNYTECDDEGWSYATDFPRFKLHLARGKSSMKRLGASVRRRRWIRMMCYVPPENSSES